MQADIQKKSGSRNTGSIGNGFFLLPGRPFGDGGATVWVILGDLDFYQTKPRRVARPSPAAGSSTVPVRFGLGATRRPNPQARTPALRKFTKRTHALGAPVRGFGFKVQSFQSQKSLFSRELRRDYQTNPSPSARRGGAEFTKRSHLTGNRRFRISGLRLFGSEECRYGVLPNEPTASNCDKMPHATSSTRPGTGSHARLDCRFSRQNYETNPTTRRRKGERERSLHRVVFTKRSQLETKNPKPGTSSENYQTNPMMYKKRQVAGRTPNIPFPILIRVSSVFHPWLRIFYETNPTSDAAKF